MTITLMIGDVRQKLKELQDNSVNCVVTSPPYWGLRDYGTGRWQGGDPDCEHKPSHTATRRGLSSSTLQGGKKNTGHQQEGFMFHCPRCGAERVDDTQIGMELTLHEHIETMVEVFREVRRVLRKDGTCWINYGDAYACKPSGRSAEWYRRRKRDDRAFRDKPFATSSADGLKDKQRMMLPARLAIALQDDGWWVRDEIIWHKPNPMPSSVRDRTSPAHEMIYLLTKSPKYFFDAKAICEPVTETSKARLSQNVADQRGSDRANGGAKTNGTMKAVGNAETRNSRSVWTIATEPTREAHFATFPTKLAERMIKAGCPVGGTVLDPFGGSGTTGLVADRCGRNAILIELNPEYADITRRRLSNDAPLLSDISVKTQPQSGEVLDSYDGLKVRVLHWPDEGRTFEGENLFNGQMSGIWDKSMFKKSGVSA